MIAGTYTFDPSVAEAIDEAWERIGLNPEKLTARHAKSAIRSMAYMLSHWPNRGILQWTVDVQTQTTTQGMVSFTPPVGTIDLLDVTIMRDGYETPLSPVSREDYFTLPNKDQQGYPNMYFVQRSITPEVFIWPAGENDTDIIRFYRLRKISDVGTLSNTLDIPSRYQDAFAAGLAAHLAPKFANDRAGDMMAVYQRTFAEARGEDRERASITIRTRQGQYRGR